MSGLQRASARFYLLGQDNALLARVAVVLVLVGAGLFGALVALTLGRDAWPGFGAGFVISAVVIVVFCIYTLGLVLVYRLRKVPLETLVGRR